VLGDHARFDERFGGPTRRLWNTDRIRELVEPTSVLSEPDRVS